jgi:ERO1-like protein alpha
LREFLRRFDPHLTNGQGPYWLKNLYFVYLVPMS